MQYTEEEYKAFGIQPPAKKKQEPKVSSAYTAEEYKAFGIEPPKVDAAPITPQQLAQPVQPTAVPVEGAKPVKPTEGQPLPFEQLYSNPDNFNKIQNYALSRFGEKEKFDPAKETKEDYVKRFATHMRMAGQNLISGTQELVYINNASKEDALKAKEAYDLFDNTASYFSKQGQTGVKPIFDALGAIVSDPVNLFSMGLGNIAKSSFMKTASEKGLQTALTSKIGSVAAIPAIEGFGSAAQNVTGQKIDLTASKAQLTKLQEQAKKSPEQATALQPEIDSLQAKLDVGVRGGEVATAGALGAIGGTLEAGALVGTARAVKGKEAAYQLDEILKAKKEAMGIKAPKVEVTPTNKIDETYDLFEGRKLLDEQGKPTDVANMQVRTDLNNKAAQIAQDIWKDIPSFAPKAEEKISDAIKRTLSDVDTIDDTQFMKSLSAADVTPEEFAKMFRTSVGDAGRTLQGLSVIKRLENKVRNIDPAAAKELDAMYGNRSALTSAFTGVRDFGMRMDRELKSLMVSQLATTIRNGFSSMTVLTVRSATEAIESALYRVGKTTTELATGKPVTGSFTGGLKGVWEDATRTAFYLGQRELSSDTTEALLKGSPSLLRIMSKTTGEAGHTGLSRPAEIANTLNVAQDSFFRNIIFTSSVEKQLSRVGIDMYDMLAKGKAAPFDVLRNAVDESLEATFSKMPTKGPMFHAVKFVEQLGPIGSTVIPFPRFMANAMSWTYKHSPMGVLSGAADVTKGMALLKRGDETGSKYLMQGLENTSKGAVGLAAVYAAYKYREGQQDSEWYNIKNQDGSTVDARALFPLSPYLALGDYLVKMKKGRSDEFKTKELVEAVTGFKAPAGTNAWLGDKFAEAVTNMQTGEGSAEQKVSTFFGEWVGEYFGRALVPAQQLSDIIAAIDRDEALPRDAYQIKQGEEGFMSSAKQQLMKRTPVVKQQLPVYQPPTKEEPVYNENGLLKMFTGITLKADPTPLEKDLVRLHVPPNKIFTSTGDKVVDAEAKKAMAPMLLDIYNSIANTEFYKESSPDMQKIMLQNTLALAQSKAKEKASKLDLNNATGEGKIPRLTVNKYAKLPPELKRETAAFYKEQTGKDLEETKDYNTALKFSELLKKRPGFAKGGVVEQTDQLFMKR